MILQFTGPFALCLNTAFLQASNVSEIAVWLWWKMKILHVTLSHPDFTLFWPYSLKNIVIIEGINPVAHEPDRGKEGFVKYNVIPWFQYTAITGK